MAACTKSNVIYWARWMIQALYSLYFILLIVLLQVQENNWGCFYYSNSSNGVSTLGVVVPDTITQWIASSYAINPLTGLGISLEKANVSNCDFLFNDELIKFNFKDVIGLSFHTLFNSLSLNYQRRFMVNFLSDLFIKSKFI